jgi:hypothetical protein
VTLIICWLVFPAVLGLLSLGLGLLVERVAGTQLAAELLLPAGFAAIVALTLFTTLSPTTAPLTVPLVLALGLVGLASRFPPSLKRFDGWAAIAAVGVFAVYAAPVVLSGDATFAGYIKLDDTSTFLAMIDRALEHGRSLDGLAPSSYEAALAFNLNFYPLGSLLPLGIGAKVVGQDPAWVFQPYLAFMAAMLGLSLYRLAGLVVPARPARAIAAFLAAQAALLYGYSLWGGVKEVAAAALLALVAALTSDAFRARRAPRALIPLGVTAAALVGVLSIGAAVWLVPAFALVALVLVRKRAGLKPVLLLAVGLMLVIPSLVVAKLVLGEGVLSSVRNKAELGNLVAALSPLQLLGVWPAGDFRFRPERMDITYALLVVVAAAALVGLVVALVRRAWEIPVYVACTVGAALVYGVLASPWIEAKAFAIASPAVVLVAVLAALALAGRRRVEGLVLLGAIALGIGWSNVLAYGDVTLAPRDQLAELETIGHEFAGQGPALMTEYQPYGVRHFLRDLDAEGASELRRRLIPLRDGSIVPKAGYADLSEFRPEAVLTYPTLVLRRTPVGTRPPAAYRLAWRGRYYEVWRRSNADAIPVSSQESRPCSPSLPVIGGAVLVSTLGRYELWVAGSVRGELTGLVDGRPVGHTRNELNHAGQFVSVGSAELAPGQHSVELRSALSRLRPGEGGDAWALGDVLLAPASRCAA